MFTLKICLVRFFFDTGNQLKQVFIYLFIYLFPYQKHKNTTKTYSETNKIKKQKSNSRGIIFVLLHFSAPRGDPRGV